MIDYEKIIYEQKHICQKYGAEFAEALLNMKVGISENVKQGNEPINGLRHPIEGDTTGWYIWAGDYSEDPNFFKPLHVKHIEQWSPIILKFLGLAPGWRFLVAEGGNYEDVWEDKSLLEI